jgi:Ca-activated chloride channel family protein
MPAELHFLRPGWFLALIPLLALLLLLGRGQAQDQVWRRLVDAHLLPHLLDESPGRARRLPLVLLALGWLLAVLALAGPVWERLPAPVFTVEAKRVILLDLSPSMNAADVPPSRLARARFEVLDLLRASREGQVALIAYGPEPFVVSPLTGDSRTIADQVPRLTSDLIPVPGPRRTDLALEAAGELLRSAGGGPGEVILISDGLGGPGGGGASEQSRAIAAARDLARVGHRVSVLGVGTPGGAPLPDKAGGFASDDAGAIRMARLDRQGLEDLARAGGGGYVAMDAGDRDTRALAERPLPVQAQMTEEEGLSADQWREEGPWVLLALLPLAALAFRRGWLLPLLACIAWLPPQPGWALDWSSLWQRPDQRAAESFAGTDYRAAIGDFQDPAWRAAARYRAGDYEGAIADLHGLAGAEPDYNRGNALAHLGRLDDAIAAYERALEQDPGLEDARANLELLRRLKEQQEQQQQDSQGGGQGDQSQQSDQSQGDQSQSQGEQGQPQEQQGQTEGDQGQSPGQEGGQAEVSQEEGDQESAEAAQSQGEGPGGGEDDFSQAAVDGEPSPEPAPEGPEAGDPEGGPSGERQGQGRELSARADGGDDLTPEERERRQSLEAQLRRVPDDPAGLLRQRFILQHLRREGRLP